MNYFSHAAVARWSVASADYCFGAMLPDFAAMIETAMPVIRSEGVRLGVAHHHRTDEVFHRSRTFLRLTAAGARFLRSRDVRRGGALAASHVGVELMIDCALGRDRVLCSDYLAALEHGAPREGEPIVEWTTPEGRRRYHQLHETLVARGLEVANGAPDRMARRIQRVLARRPRLALGDTECGVVETWASGTLPVVFDAVPLLLDELRAGLDELSQSPHGADRSQGAAITRAVESRVER